MARSEKLLDIQPHKLSFRFEVRKEASCTIRLSSNSWRNVAFKVMTTNPEKYSIKPNYGIILPGSSCDLEVTMCGQDRGLPNMLHRETLSIYSLACHDDTPERIWSLFNPQQNRVDVFDLEVACVLHQNRNLNYIQQPDRNLSPWDLLRTGIIVVFACLMFWYIIIPILSYLWYLMMQILSHLWVMISTIIFLVLSCLWYLIMQILSCMMQILSGLWYLIMQILSGLWYLIMLILSCLWYLIMLILSCLWYLIKLILSCLWYLMILIQSCIVQIPSCLWYLMMQILSRLWVMTSAITFLLLRTMKNKAVEAAEDWIWKNVLYLSLYHLGTIREKLFQLCTVIVLHLCSRRILSVEHAQSLLKSLR